MIQRSLTWFQTIFSFKSTILHVIWVRILVITAFGFLVTIFSQLHDTIFGDFPVFEVDILPLSLFGFVITILLVFLNNAAFERWWEARKLWGSLVNTARSLTRQMITLIFPQTDDLAHDTSTDMLLKSKIELTENVIGYVNGLRMHLRKEQYQVIDPSPELTPYFKKEELDLLKNQHNIANKILMIIADKMINLHKRGFINAFQVTVLEESLKDLTAIQGGCERIKYTPIPFPYKTLGNRLVVVYCLFLPFGIVNPLGWLTPFVTFFISYTLLGLAAIIDELEDPFGFESNDLPLNSICRVIEMNLREMIDQNPPDYIYPDKNGLIH